MYVDPTTFQRLMLEPSVSFQSTKHRPKFCGFGGIHHRENIKDKIAVTTTHALHEMERAIAKILTNSKTHMDVAAQ